MYDNRVLLDESATDRYGVPRLLISHRHTSRDRAAGKVLGDAAKRILRHAERSPATATRSRPSATASERCGWAPTPTPARSTPTAAFGGWRTSR